MVRAFLFSLFLLFHLVFIGSKDNMTAMIVQLQDGTAYNKEGHEFVPGPYYAGKDGKKFQEAYKADAEAAGFTLEEVRALPLKLVVMPTW